jgi:hypothetical protein
MNLDRAESTAFSVTELEKKRHFVWPTMNEFIKMKQEINGF